MVLEKLFNELGVTEQFDKIAISVLVLKVLDDSKSGLTSRNRALVIDALIDGVCEKYQFNLVYCATDWATYFAASMMEHLGLKENLINIIEKFTSENEIYPGVRKLAHL